MTPAVVLPDNIAETELGIERRCSLCGDWWPIDFEFWPLPDSRGKFSGRCRACVYEIKNARNSRVAAERRAAR